MSNFQGSTLAAIETDTALLEAVEFMENHLAEQNCRRLIFNGRDLAESMRFANTWIENDAWNHEIYSIQSLGTSIVLCIP